MVKGKGLWVTLDTPTQKIRVLPTPLPPTPHHHSEGDVDVGLIGGKICMHSRTFFFLCKQTYLTVFHSSLLVKVSHETTVFFFNVEPLVSIYIAHKINQNNYPLLRALGVEGCSGMFQFCSWFYRPPISWPQVIQVVAISLHTAAAVAKLTKQANLILIAVIVIYRFRPA